MTTSGTATAEFSVARIVELACLGAGWELEELTAGHAILGRDLLTAILNEWSNMTTAPWTSVRRSFPTVAGQESYTLGADVIDVLSGATTVRDGLQAPITPISREDFEVTSDHVTRGAPRLFWVHRGPTTVLHLSPIPDAVYTVNYWAVRRLQDVTAAGQTVDAPMRWITAVVDRLALEMFDKTPAAKRIERMPLRTGLIERAQRSEAFLKASSVEAGSWFPFG
jgi:hypothetical protein